MGNRRCQGKTETRGRLPLLHLNGNADLQQIGNLQKFDRAGHVLGFVNPDPSRRVTCNGDQTCQETGRRGCVDALVDYCSITGTKSILANHACRRTASPNPVISNSELWTKRKQEHCGRVPNREGGSPKRISKFIPISTKRLTRGR